MRANIKASLDGLCPVCQQRIGILFKDRVLVWAPHGDGPKKCENSMRIWTPRGPQTAKRVVAHKRKRRQVC
jgi:hypothetical protein